MKSTACLRTYAATGLILGGAVLTAWLTQPSATAQQPTAPVAKKSDHTCLAGMLPATW